ncbi:MAG: crotonase/enoyl-CoA hydratase family protein [Mycobacteriaceae bacterium]|nr:crotonase/enoyl-CoA hydratase family protein [Mycobacteriaceae bacterium]
MGKVQYGVDSSVATIVLDDGKVNVLSPAMQEEIHGALDSAEKDDAGAVVIAGNQKVFSAGFDLSVLRGDDPDAAVGMLAGGFDLSVRLLSFPKPVVIACTGPAIAMASFLLLSADHRVGAAQYRIQANEVAIAMTMPYAAIEVMKVRLTRSAFQRVNTMAPSFFGADAVAAGWLDELVEPAQVLPRAQQVAREALQLDAGAHAASKLRARSEALDAIRAAVKSEFGREPRR